MFKNLKLALVTTAVLVAGTLGVASADRGGQGNHPGKAAMKAQFDLDKNGTIDDAERAKMKAAFQAKRAEHKAQTLATFDANRNGTLDPAEKQAMHDQKTAERFAKLDTNRDGKLSLEEFKAGKQQRGKHARRGMGGGRR